MKTFTLLLFCCTILLFSIPLAHASTPQKKEIPKVEELDNAPNLFKSDNMYFSGQPNLETFEWLKEQGVDLVINLRTEGENEDFAEEAFNEEEMVAKLKMNYVSLPVSGYDGYTPENLEKFAEAMNGKYKKVLIHCGSAGRVTYFMMAYMVEYKGYKLADAIAFGKQIKFSFPLENLLKKEIDWQLK
ncbi:sulfur transferase domain-containing protein [Draconibacterium sp. IB214405]|uniref:fused DSP-PTPase phosphatase/NAD kinase-like protein n=1 Tax=Draconibacterium sp. IB214405 TaxID=3097352 RepID=UPI002A108594|nr:sulfur transferase domain-containing protein [Draconibacterium sp. IB214405]MDX8340565.1 sulfur transferase domain-containing protein [Draconibacterium sp. IB214405]